MTRELGSWASCIVRQGRTVSQYNTAKPRHGAGAGQGAGHWAGRAGGQALGVGARACGASRRTGYKLVIFFSKKIF